MVSVPGLYRLFLSHICTYRQTHVYAHRHVYTHRETHMYTHTHSPGSSRVNCSLPFLIHSV